MPSLEAPPLPATRFTIRSGLLLIQRPPRSFLLHSLAGGRGRNFVQHLTAPANEWGLWGGNCKVDLNLHRQRLLPSSFRCGGRNTDFNYLGHFLCARTENVRDPT